MDFIYPSIIHEDEDMFWVEFPDLTGCQSQGDTIEEVLVNGSEALELYILTLADLKKPVPKPSNIKDIKIDNNSFTSYIACKINDSGNLVEKTLIKEIKL